MKLFPLVVLTAAFVPGTSNAGMLFLTDSRSISATATQTGYTPQFTLSDSSAKVPTPPFSAFNQLTTASVPAIGAGAYQSSLLEPNHIAFFGSVNSGGHIIPGVSSAASSGTSKFAITFTVDELSIFAFSGFKWAYFAGEVRLTSAAGDLINWEANRQNNLDETGVLQPNTVYTLTAGLTWGSAVAAEFGRPDDSFSTNMSFDMVVRSAPDGGASIAIMAISLASILGFRSASTSRAGHGRGSS